MKALVLALGLLSSSAFAAAPLTCTGANGLNGSVRITHAGNGKVAATGSYVDEQGKTVGVSCVGELISFGALPGFGDQVETFWIVGQPGCPFEFIQLDDSAYKAGQGPMRLTCSQNPCPIRNFVCRK